MIQVSVVILSEFGRTPAGPTVNDNQFLGSTRLSFDDISRRMVSAVRDSHWRPVERIVQDDALVYSVTDGTTEMSYGFTRISADGTIDCDVTWNSASR